MSNFSSAADILKGKSDAAEKCMHCDIFEIKHGPFCEICYALHHMGVERVEALSKIELTEAEAKKMVNWKGT